MGLFIICGSCIHTPKYDYIVPNNCIHIRVTDFTKPCHQLSDGTLVCDGVIVHADCIKPKGDPK